MSVCFFLFIARRRTPRGKRSPVHHHSVFAHQHPPPPFASHTAKWRQILRAPGRSLPAQCLLTPPIHPSTVPKCVSFLLLFLLQIFGWLIFPLPMCPTCYWSFVPPPSLYRVKNTTSCRHASLCAESPRAPPPQSHSPRPPPPTFRLMCPWPYLLPLSWPVQR